MGRALPISRNWEVGGDAPLLEIAASRNSESSNRGPGKTVTASRHAITSGNRAAAPLRPPKTDSDAIHISRRLQILTLMGEIIATHISKNV